MAMKQTHIFNVSCCFVVKGSDSNGNPWITREFIWPSCDSPEHRRYIKSLMRQKADRMNKLGANVSVEYQELNNKGLWETTPEKP